MARVSRYASSHMRIALFVALILVALAGSSRIGLFALNRAVFGQRHEGELMKVLILLIPPLLFLLALLFWPMTRDIRNGSFTTLGLAGLAWFFVSFVTGVYWIVDRAWRNLHPRAVEGVTTLDPETIALRKAHIPFAWLRRLGAHNDLYDLEITTHEVFIHDLPRAFDGYRIAFMTDTHVTSFMRRRFYRTCVETINARNTDLVLFGGDFVTWERHIPLMAELLTADLTPRDGIFSAIGNHDYWANADKVRAALESRGVRFLVNDAVEIHRDGAAIDLTGTDEIYRGEPDLERTFRGIDGSRPCLCVSHHPDIINYLGNRRIDLLVCGHTHGGQIRLPFFGAIVVPSKHEGRYAAGFFRQNRVLMYVSRGLGAVPPIRILCKPELAFFVLRRGREEEHTVTVVI